MSKRIILSGTAIVKFRKIIDDVSNDDADELLQDLDLQESQINEEDLRDIESIHEIECEVRTLKT
ncbi:hypothetical protein ACM7N2_25775 [Pseudomonas aeruginosa]|uniref:hypothetical protein n=1 Tax=Pseudomonas aeruginosa TaxID=287 RepID=UPI00104EE8BF|nr:hypothetical protein [Pseudomonas aeruginosa]HBO1351751.1 hypothetical protein [Pseudomonas aeruginosa]